MSTTADTQWPAWERFEQLYVSGAGRVIDASTARQITTSEGQSYALFFALVGNDPHSFARVLDWTRDNLAAGDLARALPAWQWGRGDDGTWRVLDANAASDADLWMAYALGEAGRLWCNPAYVALARALSDRILSEETALIPGLGLTLLPGPKGFVNEQRWRLNASYLPLPVIRGIGLHSGDERWGKIQRSSRQIIVSSSPHGFAADWIQYRTSEQAAPDFESDVESGPMGSYDAIRVYLWAGMLPVHDSARETLARRLQPMVDYALKHTAPPERIRTDTLVPTGDGPPGFSAALLPMLANAKALPALRDHRARAESHALQSDQSYYNDVLTLFGLGWVDGRYRFDTAGRLDLPWQSSCRKSH